ncbi:hypothetical protein BH11BAC5_BH11BAC5_27360 [soil metagenome]
MTQDSKTKNAFELCAAYCNLLDQEKQSIVKIKLKGQIFNTVHFR